MSEGLFLTTAPLQEDHGGGKVSMHELAAMKRALAKRAIPVFALEQKDLMADGLPFHPFLQDYVAWYKTRGMSLDYIFINGTPFGATVQELISNHRMMTPTDLPAKVKVIIDVPAHELKDSIDEHKRMGLDYDRMYPHMVKPELWEMMNLDRRLADTIVCPSNYSVNAIKKIVQFESYTKFVVIPHGCDLPTTTNDNSRPVEPELRFGYAGSAGPDKGVIYLLHAWNTLSLKETRLCIAGQHTEDIRQQSMQLAAHGNVDAKYKWLGYMSSLAPFYAGINVYVQPSVCEGFGMEALEAAAHSIPVIISDGAGAAELFKDRDAGFVVPKRDPTKIAEAIAYYVDNPSEIKKHGANARRIAEENTWDKIERKLEALFE